LAVKQTLEIYELLDQADASGHKAAELLLSRGLENVTVQKVDGPGGYTEFVKAVIPGTGIGRTLGIIGRLGGVGARPARIGLVSDADGAIVALASALKLADMGRAGDRLPGTVIVTTHICPKSPIIPHKPVPLMSSPIDMATMNAYEVDAEMKAILSVDATKANRVINWKGIAITPTVKEGYILRISEDLLDLLTIVTGLRPAVVPITTQDITPYGNGLYHLNSIMQPSIATEAPVVGVAITTEAVVPGCATGASHVLDIECAVRFCVEVAKHFTAGECRFFDEAEWDAIIGMYGSLKHLQMIP
jgi:hypothetical protein